MQINTDNFAFNEDSKVEEENMMQNDLIFSTSLSNVEPCQGVEYSDEQYSGD